MNSLAQSTSPATGAQSQRSRGVGWAAIASGLGLIIGGEKPYFPSSLALIPLIATLVFLLGMIPAAIWLYNGLTARNSGSGAGSARIAEIVGIVGVVGASLVAVLALPRVLPTVAAEILNTTLLGVIGIWLLVANVLAFRARLINRVLAVLGAVSGVGLLLAAVIMWIELSVGNLGGLVSTFENIRVLGGYIAQALYLIWALWFGIWLLVRRK